MLPYFFPWDFILIFLQIQNVAEQFSNLLTCSYENNWDACVEPVKLEFALACSTQGSDLLKYALLYVHCTPLPTSTSACFTVCIMYIVYPPLHRMSWMQIFKYTWPRFAKHGGPFFRYWEKLDSNQCSRTVHMHTASTLKM